jgi:hypothetical protein
VIRLEQEIAGVVVVVLLVELAEQLEAAPREHPAYECRGELVVEVGERVAGIRFIAWHSLLVEHLERLAVVA